MPDRFRLAHLSDVHLPGPLPRGAELLGKRGLGALSWTRRRAAQHGPEVIAALRADLLAQAPDAVAMTGDLVNFSLAREIPPAAAWLAGLGPPERVLAVPGNHEALVRGWRARLAGLGGHVRGPAGEDHPWLRRAGPLALIAVSTAVATPPLLACGWVGPGPRARLARLIAEARAEGLVPVVLMHHPPTPIAGWRKGLADARQTRAAIGAAGAALVLHGHTHRADLSWIDAAHGRIPVLGVPSFSMRAGHGEPGGWSLLAFARAGDADTLTLTRRAITAGGEVRAATPLRLHLPRLPPCRARRSA